MRPRILLATMLVVVLGIGACNSPATTAPQAATVANTATPADTPAPTAPPMPTSLPTATPLPTITPIPTLNVSEIVSRTGRQPIDAANAGRVALLDTFGAGAIDLRFSPDSSLLAWINAYCLAEGDVDTDETRPVQLWSVQTGERVWAGRGCTQSGVRFSPDGTSLLYNPGGSRFVLRDIHTGQETEFSFPRMIVDFAFSPDGKRVVAAAKDSIWLWNVETGQQEMLLEIPEELIRSVVFAADGKRIFYSLADTVWSWDLQTATQQVLEERRLCCEIDHLVLSPGGKVLAATTWGSLVLWDVDTGRVQSELDGCCAVAFSPDGTLLASVQSGINEEILGLWDVQSGQLLASLRGHTKMIYTMDFSADGTLVASGGSDGTLLLWGISGQALELPSVAIVGAENSYFLADAISPAWLETAERPARYQIAFAGSCTTIKSCPYSEDHTYIIRQCSVTVTVTDLQSQQALGQKILDGSTSAECPQERTFVEQTEYLDNVPSQQEFSDWLISIMASQGFKW